MSNYFITYIFIVQFYNFQLLNYHEVCKFLFFQYPVVIFIPQTSLKHSEVEFLDRYNQVILIFDLYIQVSLYIIAIFSNLEKDSPSWCWCVLVVYFI